jgi:hypothetical protein
MIKKFVTLNQYVNKMSGNFEKVIKKIFGGG